LLLQCLPISHDTIKLFLLIKIKSDPRGYSKNTNQSDYNSIIKEGLRATRVIFLRLLFAATSDTSNFRKINYSIIVVRQAIFDNIYASG
jgi:hypothetical protein